MKVSFQIVHNNSKDIDALLFNAIKEAYENLYYKDLCIEKSDDELKSFYDIKYNFKLKPQNSVTGFEVEVEEVFAENCDLLKNFADKIKNDKDIFALIKFSDETRLKSYLNFYQEIAELEMQLREILSYIFYYEYSENFYNVLEEYEVTFPQEIYKDKEIDTELLKNRLENTFFYLTFDKYITLHKPKEIKNIKDINTILESSDSYENFKDKICKRGIKNKKHLDFLAGIKQDLKPIESVRNAVAHNRKIPSTKLRDYDTTKNHLIKRFQEFWEETE